MDSQPRSDSRGCAVPCPGPGESPHWWPSGGLRRWPDELGLRGELPSLRLVVRPESDHPQSRQVVLHPVRSARYSVPNRLIGATVTVLVLAASSGIVLLLHMRRGQVDVAGGGIHLGVADQGLHHRQVYPGFNQGRPWTPL